MFDRLLSLAPNHTDTLAYNGYSLWKLNRIEEAERVFDKVVALDPNMEEPIKILRAVLSGSQLPG